MKSYNFRTHHLDVLHWARYVPQVLLWPSRRSSFGLLSGPLQGTQNPWTLPRTPAHVVAYLQSEVVTCLPLLFIEANAISLLSGRLSSFEGYLELGGKYHSMCTNTFFVWYFLHSPHDPKKVRVIKEYFMGKVMLGFIGSNSNMAFAITDIVIFFLNLPSCISPNSKKAFLTAVSETVVGKNIVTKTAFGKFFLLRSFPP